MTAIATRPLRSSRSATDGGTSHPFVDPRTGVRLELRDNEWVNPVTGQTVATVIEFEGVGIPRFVDRGGGDAATFGWQWKKWRDTMSDAANKDSHRRNLILERTHFGEYDVAGKTLLECGCGAGNDTEVLLGLGFAEVHAFDLSAAVEEAAWQVGKQEAARLVLSQADITSIPYADRSFDVVYCHRVLQHTPDPERSIRSICKKVKPGGLLFAHCYLDSPLMRRHYRHKLRWLGRRLPPALVAGALDIAAPLLHKINHAVRARAAKGGKRGLRWQNFSHAWIPMAYSGNMWSHLGKAKVLEIEKCITFDAITAWHDHPMTPEKFYAIIESEGFTIDHRMETIVTARLTRAG